MRKRRTREHVIADLSVNHVERLVLLCGWTVERTGHDYGLDLLMRTYSTSGEIEGGAVWFQLKATDKLRRTDQGKSIPVRLEWRDLIVWVNDPMPVILVIYDAAKDCGFWLDVKRFFRDRRWTNRSGRSTRITLHVPAENRLETASIRQFAKLRDACLSDSGE